MARRSVWNSVYFINSGAGEYDWSIEILCERTERVLKRYTMKSDHMDDVRRRLSKELKNGEIARVDGTQYVTKY